jgi:hypothetical protein
MNNVTEFTVKTFDSEDVYVLIDRGNNEFTSMLKSTYDEMQAEQSTPSLIDEA